MLGITFNTVKGNFLRGSVTPSKPKKNFVSSISFDVLLQFLQLKTVKNSTPAHILCSIIQD